MIYLVTKTYLSKKISEWMEIITYRLTAQANANMEQLRSEMANLNPEISVYTSVTYAQLVQLRNQSKLAPGTWYRMIDYVTKVANDPEARSAEHPFDLLLLATSENTLSEEVRAMLTSRNAGTYFRKSNLNTWKVWYCLDNDSMRFMWASPSGKGVIYRMVDEWGNDCPYDFKNVQFKRYAVTDDNAGGDLDLRLDGLYMGFNADMYNLHIEDYSDYIYCYTFNSYDGDSGENEDASLSPQSFSSDTQSTANYNQRGCLQNVIAPYYAPVEIDDHINFSSLALNNICYIYRNADSSTGAQEGYGIWGNCFETGCYNMSFQSNARNNTFGQECRNIVAGYRFNYMSFSQNCYSMSFSQECGDMSFSQNCYSMSFSQGCWGMSFSQNCYSMSFSQNCYRMSFSQYCGRMSFSQYCHDMSFSQYCGRMSFSQGCGWMSFSQYCNNMSFSQGCGWMSFSQECRRMSFSQGCSNINVDAGVHDLQLPAGASNIHIFSGVRGRQSQPLGVATNADYTQFVAMGSSNNIRIFNPADVA